MPTGSFSPLTGADVWSLLRPSSHPWKGTMTYTIRQLMKDPAYREYMKRIPPRDDAFNQSDQWRLWVNVPGTNRWMTAQYATYRDVWPVFVRQLRDGNEPTITARRTFYAPPGEFYKVKVKLARPTPSGTTHRIEQRWRQTFAWEDMRDEWCGRCRRPVRFQPLFETHHALKKFPVVCDEDNVRCPICGIRRVAQPSLQNMVRM